MSKSLEKQVATLTAQVNIMIRVHQALGLPTSPWFSPQQAATIMGTSRSRIITEIEQAETARIHGRPYDLKWGVHYRRNGAHWQVNLTEFEAVIFQPPELRPPIELP